MLPPGEAGQPDARVGLGRQIQAMISSLNTHEGGNNPAKAKFFPL
jgi:hypothetical protein